jgi:signal transduction histidine kinase
MPVFGPGATANLEWAIPAHDRENLELRLSVCPVDYLLTGGHINHGTVGCTSRGFAKRTTNSTNAGGLIHCDRVLDPGVAGPGAGAGNDCRTISANHSESRITAADGAAYLLHLSLPLLELIIKESLIVAAFAAVVLAVYLYGIRRFADWTNARYGLRAGVVEAVLILALTLLAAPLRGWLERSFRSLFQRETALYRDVVARVSGSVGQYRSLNDLLNAIESQTAQALSLGRVKIALTTSDEAERTNSLNEVGDVSSEVPGAPGYNLVYPLRRENQDLGRLLIDASPNALTPDVRAVLEVLAGQIAVAIEDYRLMEENVRLERKVAAGERLAALGQMAATVAHEVKNPLSAIKSIAQVMKEDEGLNEQHLRDLSLIVGETDRLSKSVTQLLSFARTQPPAAVPCDSVELARSVAALFRADADERNISLRCEVKGTAQLDGMQTAAVRDALANLVLNALQATPPRGEVKIETSSTGDMVTFSVSDSGPGISAELRTKIWEPFFTTRQRGTGLGLAIVHKRMEEAGGSAHLVGSDNGGGATFELRIPL